MSILSKFYHAKNYRICSTYSSKSLGFPTFPHSFFNIVFLLFEIAASDRFKSLAIKLHCQEPFPTRPLPFPRERFGQREARPLALQGLPSLYA